MTADSPADGVETAVRVIERRGGHDLLERRGPARHVEECEDRAVKLIRQVVVFDADSRWVMGIQRSPGHVAPAWPEGNPQQVHLDLHVEDAAETCAKALQLRAAQLHVSGDIGVDEGFAMFADPAGHPFCIGWGQPDDDAIRRHVQAID